MLRIGRICFLKTAQSSFLSFFFLEHDCLLIKPQTTYLIRTSVNASLMGKLTAEFVSRRGLICLGMWTRLERGMLVDCHGDGAEHKY